MSRPYIGCPLLRISYDFDTRTVVLTIPADSCVDKSSASSYIDSVFPDALFIRTIADKQPDTAYVKDGVVWKKSTGATYE